MARLPTPGGDVDSWASILNEYLLVAHNSDGTARPSEVKKALNASIGLGELRTANAEDQDLTNLVLTNDNRNLVWKKTSELLKATSRIRINVINYGAVGDGVTDDTDAIQAAIDDAVAGGAVEFPRGIYLVRGLTIKKHGTALVGGARWGTRIKRFASSNEPLVNISGKASVNGHLRYCALINIALDGNGMPGPLLRSIYADSCTYLEVNFMNCDGVATDFVEVWDTYFAQCTWEHCGSLTRPAMLLRNSMPAGTFGASDDNTNQIHFLSCRWEAFQNGALRLEGNANGSKRMLNGVFLNSCKMETSIAAGPAFQIMPQSTVVFVNQLYMAMMAFDPKFNSRLNAIEDAGTHVFMNDVYLQWGPALGMAKSAVHIVRSGPHMYYKLSAYHPTEDPSVAAVWAESDTFDIVVSCLVTNRGKAIQGDASVLLQASPRHGAIIPINHEGSFRVTTAENGGKDLVKVDNNATRPALNALNGVDTAGFADNYIKETWRVVGATGAARFAAGKFRIDGSKGYMGINTVPVKDIAMLIRPATASDRGIAVIRPARTANMRLLEFQDETYGIQGQAFDFNGRPVAVGTPARVTPGSQVSYANPDKQVRDIAGNVTAAVRPSPTAPGPIATITFSRPYAAPPLAITINDHSPQFSFLYVSNRSTTGFTVSTRSALQGGSIIRFDYIVIA